MKIIPIIMATVVGVLIIGSVLAPIVSTAADGQRYVNDSDIDIRWRVYDSEDANVTINWYSTDIRVVINDNGATYELASSDLAALSSKTLVYSDGGFIRINGSVSGAPCYVFDSNTSVIYNSDYTMSFVNGVVTLEIGSSTYSGTFEKVAVPSINGDYVLSSGDQILNKDSTIILADGETYFTDPAAATLISSVLGTVEDLDVKSYLRDSSVLESTTISDVETNFEELRDGVVRMSSIEWTSSYVIDGEDYDSNLTYSYYLVPAVVYGDPVLANPIMPMLIVIPLMAVLLLAVSAFFRGRY